MTAARRILRWAWLGCALCLAPVLAQDRPSPPPAPRADGPSEPAPPPPSPPPPEKTTSTREFRPSEDVSPDQEVDFPADL